MADVKSALKSNMPVVIAGAVAIAAAGAWLYIWTSPDEDLARAPKAVAKTEKSDGLPPIRALPPAGADLLPPLKTPPPEPSKADEAKAPPAKVAEPVKAEPAQPAKVAPSLPVTAGAAPVEKPAPAAPAPKRAERAAEPSAVATGRYVGNISGGEAAGLTLTISSVEGGAVRATAAVTGGGVCDDSYPMQGTLRGGRLELRATRMGGRAGDCPLNLSLSVEGDRMTGATGSGGGVQLTKR